MKKWEENSPSRFDSLILADRTFQELVLCLGKILTQVFLFLFYGGFLFLFLDIFPPLTSSFNELQVPGLKV